MVTVGTLKYLAMGGRIGKVQALLGWVLQSNPIVGIRDGETHPVDRPRTRRRAQRRIIELVRELAPIHQLHVSYSTGRDKALAIRDELADLVESERHSIVGTPHRIPVRSCLGYSPRSQYHRRGGNPGKRRGRLAALSGRDG